MDGSKQNIVELQEPAFIVAKSSSDVALLKIGELSEMKDYKDNYGYVKEMGMEVYVIPIYDINEAKQMLVDKSLFRQVMMRMSMKD